MPRPLQCGILNPPRWARDLSHAAADEARSLIPCSVLGTLLAVNVTLDFLNPSPDSLGEGAANYGMQTKSDGYFGKVLLELSSAPLCTDGLCGCICMTAAQLSRCDEDSVA